MWRARTPGRLALRVAPVCLLYVGGFALATALGLRKSVFEDTDGSTPVFFSLTHRTAICYCSLGNPPSVSGAAKSQRYFQEAKKLWEIWKSSHSLFDKPQGVDVLVPILYKREIMPFDDSVDETVLPTQKEAEQKIEEAEKTANDAAFRAAKISTAAGLQYQPPAGIAVDLSSLSKPEKAEKSTDALQKEILKTEAELKAIEEERSSLDAKTGVEEQEVKAALLAAQQKLTEMQMMKKRGRPRSNRQSSQVGLNPLNVAQDSINQMLGNIDTRELEPIPIGVRPKRGRRAPREERRLLRKSEFSPNLINRRLQVFWPPDKTWWSVTIRDVQVETNKATLLYDTGETEEVDFKKLINARELAWPVGEDPPQAEHQTFCPPAAGTNIAPDDALGRAGETSEDCDMDAALDEKVYMALTVPEVAALGSEAVGQDVQVFWKQEKKWADAVISDINPEEEVVAVEYGFGVNVSLHASQNCILRFVS